MAIATTGNDKIDTAAAEIALALRDAEPGHRDQYYYDDAVRLRDAIMAGTRELDAARGQASRHYLDSITSRVTASDDILPVLAGSLQSGQVIIEDHDRGQFLVMNTDDAAQYARYHDAAVVRPNADAAVARPAKRSPGMQTGP